MEYRPLAESGKASVAANEDAAVPPQLPGLATLDPLRLKLEGLRSDMLIVSEVTLPMLKNMEDEARVKREDAQRRLEDKKAQLEAQVRRSCCILLLGRILPDASTVRKAQHKSLTSRFRTAVA